MSHSVKKFDRTAFTVSDYVVESLWVGIRWMRKKGHVVAVYYKLFSQDVIL